MTLTDSPPHPVPALEVNFRPRFTEALDGDSNESARSRETRDIMWSHVPPVKSRNPQLIAWISEMADQLGVDMAADPHSAAQVFTGTTTLNGTRPYAMRYGGHQFGNWAGQLGDGRAIALGELADTDGKHWTLQLKGAGPTPYSRQGDGFAVLRSSIREYLCAEAMHHLGIPTTRSLSLCLTGERIARDVFYNGHVEEEPGAIVCRVAESFVRFGSFEIHAAQRETRQLKQLAEYVIREHYPHLWSAPPSIDTYQQWFADVLQRTASLIAEWQRVGFVHAVMNTDNMSILGQTIDYGPYGWLEEYDNNWTPNFIDQQGRRYTYGNQPQIALWNLYRLANAVLPLFDDKTGPLEEVLSTYDTLYDDLWHQARLKKTGLVAAGQSKDQLALLNGLWEILEQSAPDYTVFFKTLTELDRTQGPADLANTLSNTAYYEPAGEERIKQLEGWLTEWLQALADVDSQAVDHGMQTSNPKYVLRNYIAIEAIDAAEKGDFDVLHNVAEMIKRPYEDQPEFHRYASLRPDWARSRPGCTMLTCSS